MIEIPTKLVHSLLASVIILCSLGGCTSAQTYKRADDFQKVGEATETAASKIRGILRTYNPTTTTDNQLVAMVVGVLPEGWRAQYERAVEVGTDVWVAASDIASALEVTAVDSYSESDRLRAQADSQADKWSNFKSIVESGINVAANPTGIVAVAGGLLAGLLKRWGDKNLERVVVAFDNAQAVDPALRERVRANGEGIRDAQGERLAKKIDKYRVLEDDT